MTTRGTAQTTAKAPHHQGVQESHTAQRGLHRKATAAALTKGCAGAADRLRGVPHGQGELHQEHAPGQVTPGPNKRHVVRTQGPASLRRRPRSRQHAHTDTQPQQQQGPQNRQICFPAWHVARACYVAHIAERGGGGRGRCGPAAQPPSSAGTASTATCCAARPRAPAQGRTPATADVLPPLRPVSELLVDGSLSYLLSFFGAPALPYLCVQMFECTQAGADAQSDRRKGLSKRAPRGRRQGVHAHHALRWL